MWKNSRRFPEKAVEDLPGPGQYEQPTGLIDPNTAKHYGFLQKSKRFPSPRPEGPDGQYEEDDDTRTLTENARGRTMSRKEDIFDAQKWKKECDRWQGEYERVLVVQERETALLEEKIVKSEAQIKELIKERADLQTRNSTKEKEIADALKREAVIRTNLDKAEKAVTNLHEKAIKYSALQKKVDELEKHGAKARTVVDKRVEGLVKENRDLQDRLRRLSLEKSELSNNVEQASANQNEELMRALQELERLNNAFQDGQDTLTQVSDQLNDLQETLQRERHQHLQQTSQLESQLADLRRTGESHRVEMEDRIHDLLEGRSLLAEQVEAQSLEIHKLQAELDASCQGSKAMEAKYHAKLNSLQQRIDELSRRSGQALADKESELKEWQSRASRSEKELSSRVKELEAKLKQDAATISKLETSIVESAASNATKFRDLEEQLRSAHAARVEEVSSLSELLDQTESAHVKEIKSLTGQLAESHQTHQQEVSKLQDDIKRREALVAELQQKWKSSESAAASKYDDLEQSSHNIKRELEGQLSIYGSRLDSVMTQNQNLQAQLDAKVRELEQNRAEIEEQLVANRQHWSSEQAAVQSKLASAIDKSKAMATELESERHARSQESLAFRESITDLERIIEAKDQELADMTVSHRTELAALDRVIEAKDQEMAGVTASHRDVVMGLSQMIQAKDEELAESSSSHQTIIREYDARIDQLTSDVESLQHQLQQEEAERQTLDSRIPELSAALESVEAELAQALKANEDLTMRARADTIRAEDAVREQWAAAEEAFEADKVEWKKRLEGLFEQNKSYKSSLEAESREKRGALKAIEEVKAELMNAKTETKEAKIELAKVKSDLAQARTELTGSKKDLSGTHAELSTANKTISTVKAELARTLSELEAQKAARAKEVEELKYTSSKAKENHDSIRLHLQEQIDELSVALEAGREEKIVDDDKIQALTRMVELKEDELATERTHNDKLSQANTTLQSRVSTLESDLRKEREERAHEASNSHAQIITMTNRIKEADDAMKQLEATTTKRLASANEQYQQDRQRREKEMLELGKQVEKLLSRSEQLERQFSDVSKNLSRKEARLEELESTLQARTAESDLEKVSRAAEMSDLRQRQAEALELRDRRERDLTAQVQDLKKSMADKDRQLEEVRGKMRITELKTTNDISGRDERLRLLDGQLSDLRKQLDSLRDENIRLRKNFDAEDIAKRNSEQNKRAIEEERSHWMSRESRWDGDRKRLEALVEEQSHELQQGREEMTRLQAVADEADHRRLEIEETLRSQVQLLMSKSGLAEAEMGRLAEINADLLGHNNARQKIKHIAQLKEENVRLKKENLVLAKQRDELRRKTLVLERDVESIRPVPFAPTTPAAIGAGISTGRKPPPSRMSRSILGSKNPRDTFFGSASLQLPQDADKSFIASSTSFLGMNASFGGSASTIPETLNNDANENENLTWGGLVSADDPRLLEDDKENRAFRVQVARERARNKADEERMKIEEDQMRVVSETTRKGRGGDSFVVPI
ncbi:hypothetical protein SmJEL517_g01502 [Synchytrium microbalum]|uniref:Hyaluronan-mediated motility receptor C-terminal domain-containing protein n=1 Tax=Synchytrium microbalum TaxID=1806994 RepID=A0A507C9D5_9FUNG|nr:uncharacterized protein SmJEL517_g01502 [Synchytrium microbalum]TPX36212.1 hypothetical protein SmJEL517_g01502 [Synchytrium microbalum]